MEITSSEKHESFFEDWKRVLPGNWSQCGGRYVVSEDLAIEIGLYREPKDGTEYSKNYTLQVFDGEEVPLCIDLGKCGEVSFESSRAAEICGSDAVCEGKDTFEFIDNSSGEKKTLDICYDKESVYVEYNGKRICEEKGPVIPRESSALEDILEER